MLIHFVPPIFTWLPRSSHEMPWNKSMHKRSHKHTPVWTVKSSRRRRRRRASMKTGIDASPPPPHRGIDQLELLEMKSFETIENPSKFDWIFIGVSFITLTHPLQRGPMRATNRSTDPAERVPMLASLSERQALMLCIAWFALCLFQRFHSLYFTWPSW